jgi:hypothetical protein
MVNCGISRLPTAASIPYAESLPDNIVNAGFGPIQPV